MAKRRLSQIGTSIASAASAVIILTLGGLTNVSAGDFQSQICDESHSSQQTITMGRDNIKHDLEVDGDKGSSFFGIEVSNKPAPVTVTSDLWNLVCANEKCQAAECKPNAFNMFDYCYKHIKFKKLTIVDENNKPYASSLFVAMENKKSVNSLKNSELKKINENPNKMLEECAKEKKLGRDDIQNLLKKFYESNIIDVPITTIPDQLSASSFSSALQNNHFNPATPQDQQSALSFDSRPQNIGSNANILLQEQATGFSLEQQNPLPTGGSGYYPNIPSDNGNVNNAIQRLGHSLENIDISTNLSVTNPPPNNASTTNTSNGSITGQSNNSSILMDYPTARELTYPQFVDITARVRSFGNWRFSQKQTPRKLAEAGYFYTGEGDITRCFCCDLGLAEWDPKDDPWVEHARHNPKCPFLNAQKSHEYIERIQLDWKKIYNPKHAAFDDKESRIATFDDWRKDLKQTPEILADAGFFNTGEEDTVRCHYCDGGLRNWEPKDVPWEEHARWFPFCKFVIKMKGREFIEEMKKKFEPRQQTENTNVAENTSNEPSELKKHLVTMGFAFNDVSSAINKFEQTNNYSPTKNNISHLIDIIRSDADNSSLKLQQGISDTNEKIKPDAKKIRETNRQLKLKMLCIRCRTNDICMLFVNCGHRQTCEECADLMDFCPICDTRIKKRLKTYLSSIDINTTDHLQRLIAANQFVLYPEHIDLSDALRSLVLHKPYSMTACKQKNLCSHDSEKSSACLLLGDLL